MDVEVIRDANGRFLVRRISKLHPSA
jgi:hypothetical protein